MHLRTSVVPAKIENVSSQQPPDDVGLHFNIAVCVDTYMAQPTPSEPTIRHFIGNPICGSYGTDANLQGKRNVTCNSHTTKPQQQGPYTISSLQ